MADITKIQPFGSSTQYELGARYLTTARNITIGSKTNSFNGTANISYTPYDMKLCRALYDTDSNPNTFADHGIAIGMISLSDNGSVDNPGGKTGWHHIFQSTWTDTADNNNSTTNEWCTQIMNACGSTDLWVRSKAGGSITNGTAWAAPWTRILTGTNYTNYTVTKTGSGASGTWGINISGNAATATKATQDSSGNTITSTYVKKSGDTMTGVLTMNLAGEQLRVPYNGSNYNVLHNHNNGNYSLNATGNGLYMGYSNTAFMNWLDGKAFLRRSDGAMGIGTSNPGHRLHVSGGNIGITDGQLYIVANGNTARYGPMNADWVHAYNSANKPYYFDTNVYANGGFTVYDSSTTYLKANVCHFKAGGIQFQYGSSDYWILQNYENANIVLNSCGGGLYLGYQTCNGIYLFTGNAQRGYVNGNGIYGAVWNDYAEFREIPEAQIKYTKDTNAKEIDKKELLMAGHCVREVGDDTMILTTERLQKGCKVISDTYGFCVGETEQAKTPIAVSGRALVYIYEGREEARKHIGDCVCSGPNGTVSIMTEEEEMRYPGRIVGTISAVPDYETWGENNINVNGRIWIYVR